MWTHFLQMKWFKPGLISAAFFWPWLRTDTGCLGKYCCLAVVSCEEQRCAEVMSKHTGPVQGWGEEGDWKHICSAFDPTFCSPARHSPQLPTLCLTAKQWLTSPKTSSRFPCCPPLCRCWLTTTATLLLCSLKQNRTGKSSQRVQGSTKQLISPHIHNSRVVKKIMTTHVFIHICCSEIQMCLGMQEQKQRTATERPIHGNPSPQTSVSVTECEEEGEARGQTSKMSCSGFNKIKETQYAVFNGVAI